MSSDMAGLRFATRLIMERIIKIMAKTGNQHVVPHNGGWAVRGEGNSRVTSQHQTQRGAIDAGREVARNQGGELLIHGRNGQIRERDSVGNNDPHPPRG